jgi:2-aminoadipate transaminase
MSRALANPKLISLAAGFVDQQSLPVEPTRRALDVILSDPQAARAALQYGTTPGYPALREALLEHDRVASGGASPPIELSQIIVTAGSNQLLHLIADTILDPGDLVLTASPTYLVFLGTLNNVGARAYGIASDCDGMIPEALDDGLASLKSLGLLSRVKAIYLVPYFENPTGATLNAQRRGAIVDVVRRWSQRQKMYVIADNAYRELRFVGAEVPALSTFDPRRELVIEAGTFSKSFSPGIRVGWGMVPIELVDPICNQKGNIDFGSPNFSQHLMAKVLELDLYSPHIRQLRQTYSQKRDAMLGAADEFLAHLEGVQWRRPRPWCRCVAATGRPARSANRTAVWRRRSTRPRAV